MYIYLSRKYTFENLVLIIEVAKITSHRDVVYETIKEENFQKFYDSVSHNNKLDFKVVNNEIVCDHYVRVVELPTLGMVSTLPEEGTTRISHNTSLYDLLIDLANERCLYSATANVDLINPSLYSFRTIRISKSTMSVGISVKNEEESWRTKNIISVNDEGQLHQNVFFCLIPLNSEIKFSKYNLEFLSDCSIYNSGYKLFKYKCDLPICSSTDRKMFCEPVINHYTYLESLYKTTLDVLNNYLKGFIKPAPPAFADPRAYKRSNNQGVFFKHSGAPKKVKEASEYVTNLVTTLNEECRKSNRVFTDEMLYSYIENNSLHEFFYYSGSILLKIVNSDKVGEKLIPLDAISNCKKVIDNYNLLLLNIQLMLYNIRVACVFDNRILTWNNYNKFEIMGSYFNSSTIVTIR